MCVGGGGGGGGGGCTVHISVVSKGNPIVFFIYAVFM